MGRKGNLDSLVTKKRDLMDLANFVGTRAGETPNYCLLLGSGCSITSGVRSAQQLIEVWRKELYDRLARSNAPPYSPEDAIRFFMKEHSQWYSQEREYSSLFEKKFDLAAQRRMFVESEVAKKLPSIGYAYLMQLVAKRYFGTIFTTNFDDLLNEAFHYFSDDRPIICAHDSSISSITVTSTRPKIIKLHGDYLFDDIKSTQRETESLEENTKKKFAEFARDFGLIVVGYSGCDRSIMDVLNNLLRNEDYFKKGVYWCVRPGEKEIPEELERLLWRDRAYWVEIDGYDELMAELYAQFGGQALPVDTTWVSEKPRKIIESFCCNKFLENTASQVVRNHLDRLRQELMKEQVVDAFRGMRNTSSEETDEPAQAIRDDQAAKLMRLRQLVTSRELKQAKALLAAELQTAERDFFFTEVAKLKVEVDCDLGDVADARNVVEMLKEYDPYNSFYFVMAADVETTTAAKKVQLQKALELEPASTLALNRMARVLLDCGREKAGAERTSLINDGLSYYRQSINADPSLRNPAWVRLGKYLLATNDVAKSLKMREVDELIEKYEAMSQKDIQVLKLKLRRLEAFKELRTNEATSDLLARIKELCERAPRYNSRSMQLVHVSALNILDKQDELRQLISQLDLDDLHARSHEYQFEVSKCYSGTLADVKAALTRCVKAFELSPLPTYAIEIAHLSATLRDPSVLREKGEQLLRQLSAEEMRTFRLFEAQAEGDHEGAIRIIRAAQPLSDAKYDLIVEEVHELLFANKAEEAERIARKFLEEVNFSAHFGALIINYELARKETGKSVNKGRLGDLVKNATNEEVKACAYFLLGEEAHAKNALLHDSDGAALARYKNWFIFGSNEGERFLEQVEKAAAGC